EVALGLRAEGREVAQAMTGEHRLLAHAAGLGLGLAPGGERLLARSAEGELLTRGYRLDLGRGRAALGALDRLEEEGVAHPAEAARAAQGVEARRSLGRVEQRRVRRHAEGWYV